MQTLHIPASRTVITEPNEQPNGTWSQSIQVFLDDGHRSLDLVLYSPLRQSLIPAGDHRGPDVIEARPEADSPDRDASSPGPAEKPRTFPELLLEFAEA